MAETTPETTTRPSERELKRQFDADVRRVQELQPKVEAKKATGYESREFAETATRANATLRELRERRAQDALNEGGRRHLWKIGRRYQPLSRAREIEGRVLDGVNLDHALLTDDEIADLRPLLKARLGDDETPEQAARFEDLIGKAAGEPGLYARRRTEITKEDEMKAEATKLAKVFLPRRREPEPGSIELPAFLLAWCADGQEGSFDLQDLGVLAAVALSFANQSVELLPTARFVLDDDGPKIVISDAGARVRLRYGADDTGHLNFRKSLAALDRNGWTNTTRHRSKLTIRQGKRLKKLWPEAGG